MNKEMNDFALKKGVLGVGLPVGLIMSIITGYQTPGYVFKVQAFDFHAFLNSLALLVPIFLIAGYVWGILVYRFIHKK